MKIKVADAIRLMNEKSSATFLIIQNYGGVETPKETAVTHILQEYTACCRHVAAGGKEKP